jgi:hypothetical protein
MTHYGQQLAAGAIASKPRTEPPPPPPPSIGRTPTTQPDVTLSAVDSGELVADCGHCIHDEGMPIKWAALAAKITDHDAKCPAAGDTP